MKKRGENILDKINEQKFKLQLYGCIIIFIAVFISTYMIRMQIISSFTMRTFMWGINYVGYMGIFLVFITQSISCIKRRCIYWLMPIVALIFPLITFVSLGKSKGALVIYISCCILPLYLMYVQLLPEKREYILRILLCALNIIMLVMLTWAIIDKMFDRPILKALESHITCDASMTWFANSEHPDHKRFYSIYGHPLINIMWFNVCYVLNVVWNRCHKPIVPQWLIAILSFAAAACCGSKTGFVAVIGITVIAFYKNKKMYIFLFFAALFVIVSGLMDNLVVRFATGSLTTGRIGELKRLLMDADFPFYFFKGYGGNVTPYGTAAFEFPLIDMAFCYGIVYAIIMLGLPLVFVVMHCVRVRAFSELLLWGILFAEANTFYTCFHEWSDNPMIFYFLTMIFLNIVVDNAEKCKMRSEEKQYGEK